MCRSKPINEPVYQSVYEHLVILCYTLMCDFQFSHILYCLKLQTLHDITSSLVIVHYSLLSLALLCKRLLVKVKVVGDGSLNVRWVCGFSNEVAQKVFIAEQLWLARVSPNPSMYSAVTHHFILGVFKYGGLSDKKRTLFWNVNQIFITLNTET